MILSTKLLNLFGILAVIGSSSPEVTVAMDDLDDTLKQALFLVKLLKADFSQILRANNDVAANSTEEENSTCSLPSEEFNSTMAINETEATVSLVTLSTPATPPPFTPATPPPFTRDAPPAPPNTLTPGAPMMMPYASWPPMPMGYQPPSGPGRQNFPDENYRFPYRLSRRRLMPDYYYFDSPAKSRGNFRRYGNDPTGDLVNTPATSQAQNASSLSSATSEVTTLHVEETTASGTSLETTLSTTSLQTTLAQPSTSILTTAEQAILRTTMSANQTIPTAADSAKQSTPALTATSTKQSIPPTADEPDLPTIILSTPTKTTKNRKRIRLRKRVSVSKASTTIFYNRNENHTNVSRHPLRHRTHHTTTTEKWTKDGVVMSQVASELEKELENNYSEEGHAVHGSYKDSKNLKSKKPSKKTTTTTMKIFLQGSSRIPIPFPENNGFCHFYPENALCGAT